MRAAIFLVSLTTCAAIQARAASDACWEPKQAVVSSVSLGRVDTRQMLAQFQNSPSFWQQFEVAREIVALHDPSILPDLRIFLDHEDRHLRGNAAFIFASLGDDRGFEVLRSILGDRGYRPQGQGDVVSGDMRYHVEQQIAADRYYVVHLFGDLGDPRAVPILIPLLGDEEVKWIVPWSLGAIGDKRAVAPLIGTLADHDPSVRVLAICALVKLRASDALPALYRLLDDDEQIHFGDLSSVSATAKAAITALERLRAP